MEVGLLSNIYTFGYICKSYAGLGIYTYVLRILLSYQPRYNLPYRYHCNDDQSEKKSVAVVTVHHENCLNREPH
jgi:hypothetical protein